MLFINKYQYNINIININISIMVTGATGGDFSVVKKSIYKTGMLIKKT